ncbi:hypothetical protein C8J56DRAFT_897400 [Mycena floridula]|nr:hypothetical protein C8J56DRAFT_897400 [Mycena floridula]
MDILLMFPGLLVVTATMTRYVPLHPINASCPPSLNENDTNTRLITAAAAARQESISRAHGGVQRMRAVLQWEVVVGEMRDLLYDEGPPVCILQCEGILAVFSRYEWGGGYDPYDAKSTQNGELRTYRI